MTIFLHFICNILPILSISSNKKYLSRFLETRRVEKSRLETAQNRREIEKSRRDVSCKPYIGPRSFEIRSGGTSYLFNNRVSRPMYHYILTSDQ